MKKNPFFTVFGFFIGLLIIPLPARAYLDLGTGSYVIQMVIASAVGISFFIKMHWRRIAESAKRFVSKAKKDGDHHGEAAGN